MIKKALIAAASLLALSAHAGYAQLAAPQGFGGSAGSYTYAAAANDRVFGRVVHSAGSLTANVGGQAVKMGAAYRFAANAPRFAARALFVNPYVAVGVGIAAWLGSKYVWNDEEQQWKAIDGSASLSDGQLYRAGFVEEWAQSKDAACNAAMAAANANPYASESSKVVSCTPTAGLGFSMVTKAGNTTNYSFLTKPSSCPAGWYITTAGCTQTPPMRAVPEEEFVEDLAKRPMPQTVPQELPYPTPLPIEQPSPWINPTPGENPQSQPLRIPTGQPSPIPNTDPQQYRQPYVDIVPAPTPDNPFRVDVKPGETVSTDPNPVENPKPDGQDKPTEEQDKSLCERHPEIAACEKVEVTDKPLPDQPKLYEPKYPDGISGLWNSKLQEIKATPLFNLAPALLPNVSTGSCPSWKVDLSIDGWTNAGLQDVSPPCWVWDVAKLVIIASALLLARRLIFGG